MGLATRLALLSFCCHCLPLVAENHLGVSLTAAQFRFDEFQNNGSTFLEEQGQHYGAGIRWDGEWGAWRTAAEFEITGGDVDYSYSNLKSTTRHRIYQYELLAGRAFHSDRVILIAWLGLGERKWDREIEGVGGNTGLSENYSWPFVSAGITAQTNILAQTFSLYLSARHTFNADMTAVFDDDIYGSGTLDMDDGQGYSMSLTWMCCATLVPSLFYDYWFFERTGSVNLSNGGVLTGYSAAQPENKTQVIGLKLQYSFF